MVVLPSSQPCKIGFESTHYIQNLLDFDELNSISPKLNQYFIEWFNPSHPNWFVRMKATYHGIWQLGTIRCSCRPCNQFFLSFSFSRVMVLSDLKTPVQLAKSTRDSLIGTGNQFSFFNQSNFLELFVHLNSPKKLWSNLTHFPPRPN